MLCKLTMAAAILVFLLTRLVHDSWTDRGRTAESVESAAARLSDLPLSLGPWQGKELDLDAADVEQARLASYRWRRYQNAATGDAASVLLVCGRPGPMGVHTPEACYGGGGYDMAAPPQRVAHPRPSPARAAEFWTARFRKTSSAAPEDLRIYWSWNAAGTWKAADSPRLDFARFSVLYKIYVIVEETSAADSREAKSTREFLDLLLPALDKALAGGSENRAPVTD